MKLHPAIEASVYVLIIVLSIIALWLVLVSPVDMLNSRVVYQGF